MSITTKNRLLSYAQKCKNGAFRQFTVKEDTRLEFYQYESKGDKTHTTLITVR